MIGCEHFQLAEHTLLTSLMSGEGAWDWACGLLVLVLAAQGGRVVLHLLRQHPATSSPWMALNGTVLLMLMLGAQGSLLLASFWLLAGWDCMALDFCLYRAMELLCPLALVQASLGYWRGAGEASGDGQMEGDTRTLKMSDPLSRKGTVIAKKRSFVGRGPCWMSFLWVYLWTVAIAASAGAVFGLLIDPCIVHRESSFRSSSADDEDVEFDEVRERGDRLTAVLLSEMDVSLGFEDHQELVSVLRSAQKNISNYSALMGPKDTGCVWVNMSIRSEILLYCAFFLPLLYYVAFHVWHFTRQPPSPELEAGVQDDVNNTDSHSGQSFRHTTHLQSITPTYVSDDADNSLQKAQRSSTARWTKLIEEEKYTQSLKTRFLPEEDYNLVVSKISDSTLCVKPEKPKSLSMEDSRTLYVKPENSQSLPKEEPIISKTEPIPASQVQTHEPQPVQPAETDATRVVDSKGDDCSVCQQVVPYVPLVTLAVLVQHVLLVPLWTAFCWSYGHTHLYPLPSCVLIMPVYCALLFTFLTVLNRP